MARRSAVRAKSWAAALAASSVVAASVLTVQARAASASVPQWYSAVVAGTPLGSRSHGSYAGDGGPAVLADFYWPSGVTTDRSGNVYVADFLNSRVREFSTSTGLITTAAGGGSSTTNGAPAISAALYKPQGLAVDSSGDIFIVDGTNVVKKVSASTGLISTFAGNGTSGFLGDGGPATAAELNAPTGLAVDSSGDVFIADSSNNRIREVNASTGVITTVVGNGTAGYSGDGIPAASAELNSPQRVTVDSLGDIFITDVSNYRIREVSASSGTSYGQSMTVGDIYTVAGNGTSGYYAGDGGPATQAVIQPISAAVDSARNLYVFDFGYPSGGGAIRQVTLSGTINTIATGFSSFGNLYGDLAVDSHGNLFVSSSSGDVVDEVTSTPQPLLPSATGMVFGSYPVHVQSVPLSVTLTNTGTSSVTITTTAVSGADTSDFTITANSCAGANLSPGATCSVSASFDPSVTGPRTATITVTDSASSSPQHIYLEGDGQGYTSLVAGVPLCGRCNNGSYGGDGGPAVQAHFFWPTGLAADNAGNVYVSDFDNGRIREFSTSNGIITTKATSSGQGLARDSAGNLYVSLGNSNIVEEISAATGQTTTIAGTGTSGFNGDGVPATQAELNAPAGLEVDTFGNLVIADSGNNRIRIRATTTGTFYRQNMTAGDIYTLAGNGTAGFNMDGIPATNAELSDPVDVALDAANNLYIAEYQNNRVREVASSTQLISTVVGNGSSGYASPRGDGGPASLAYITPMSLAIDPNGNLLVYSEQQYGDAVREVEKSTGYVDTIASGFANFGNLFGDITVDSQGNIFVTQSVGNVVDEITAAPPPGYGLTTGQLLGGAKNPSMYCLPCAQPSRGDPVELSTGNLWETHIDLSIPGRGPALSFSRTYNSAQSTVNGPLGYGWTDSYNMTLTFNPDTTVTVSQENASQVTFTPGASGGFTEPSDVEATLTHNGDGTFSFTRRGTQFFTFDSTGRLTGEKDLNRYLTTISYPSSTQEVVTDPAGRTLTFTLSAGHVAQVADSAGRTITYGYNDSYGDLTDVVDANGGHWQYIYNSTHQLLMMRSARYFQAGSLPAAPTSCSGTPPADFTVNVYDSSGSSGRVACQWDPDGRQTNYDYTSLPGSTEVSDPKGNTSVYTFVNGLLAAETQGYGTSNQASSIYGYDPISLGIIQERDPNGNVTLYRYDSQGNRLSATDPLSRTTTWTYNQYNQVASVAPPVTYGGQTVTTTYTYDESAYSSAGSGNLTTVSTPILSSSGSSLGTQVTHYRYGDSTHPGDVTSRIDSAGSTWSYTYDADGDKVSQAAPATSDNSDGSGPGVARANVTKWVYNTPTGWVTEQMSPRFVLANPTATTCTPPATGCSSFTHDSLGRVLVTSDGNGHTTQNHYDPDGNRDYSIDADNNKTGYTYDPAGQLTITTRADNTTTKTNYWPDGTVEDQIDANIADTHYTYDPLGHLASTTDPDNRVTSYTYDGVGNLLVKGDPGVSGCTTSSTTKGCTIYSYDAANQQTAINYNDPGVTSNVTAIGYDGNGRRTSMTEQIQGSTTNSVTSTWVYDSLSQVSSATDINGATVSYGYDPRGLVTSIVYPGNGAGTVTRDYDPAGRMDWTSDWQSNKTTFLYDADSNLTNTSEPTTGSPVTDSYTYDPAGVLSAVSTQQGPSTLGSFNYGRDHANQLTGSTETGVPSPNNTSYGYDPLNRVTTAGGTGYGYDPANNPTTLANGTHQVFDAADQLSSGTAKIVMAGATPNTQTLSSSIPLSRPGSTLPGDALIAAVTTSAQNGPTIPPGWTMITGSQNGGGTTWVFWHLASSSDQGSWSFGVNNSAADIAGAILDYHNTANTPLDATAVNQGIDAAGTSQILPSVTSTANYEEIVHAVGYNGAVTSQAPSGDSDQTTSSTALASLMVSDNNQSQAGPSGTPSATSNLPFASEVMTFALKPAVTSYGYDARGNRTGITAPNGTASTLGYDQARRLTSYTTTGLTDTYAYNGDGLRMSKTVNGTTHTYLWDTTTTTPHVLEDNGTAFVYGPEGQTLEQINLQPNPITLVATGQNADSTGNSTTLTAPFSVPTGSGDQILAAVTVAANATLNIPSDYTLVANVPSTEGNKLVIFRKTAAGGESSVTVTTPQASATNLIVKSLAVVVYRGVDPNNPLDGLNSNTTPSTTTGPTTLTVPSVTTTGSTDQLVIVESASSLVTPSGNWTPPTGMTTRADAATTLSIAVVTELADQTLTSSGPTGSRSASYPNGTSDLIGELVALRRAPPPVLYLHHDQLGSTRVLTTNAGAVAGTATFDSYGNLAATTGTITPIGYAGAYTDTETGLQYLINRYYDPSTAQYVSVDPAVGTTQQPYTYVGDSPLNGTDPLGLCWPKWACGAEHAIGGAATTTVRFVGGVAQEGAHLLVDAVTDPFYLSYWAALDLNGGIHAALRDLFGHVGCDIANVIGAPLLPIQAAGLGVDVGGDWIKEHLLGIQNYTVGDEGNPNAYLLGSQAGPIARHIGINWRHDFPGVHPNGRIDWWW